MKGGRKTQAVRLEAWEPHAWRDGNLEKSAYRDVTANKRTICLVGRQVTRENFSVL
jgi:hypothetical protein